MTASRLAALTFGELRSTSDTSDFDTPARAATVSSVGLRPARPGPRDDTLPPAVGAVQQYERNREASTAPGDAAGRLARPRVPLRARELSLEVGEGVDH